MYHPLRDQGIDPNEFPESEVMTIDVLPKWAYTNHPVKLTYDRKEDPNVSLSVVRSKEIEAINEYLASITAGLAAANARIKDLQAQVAGMQSVYDAVRRLEEWNNKTWHFYTAESYNNGVPGHLVILSREGRRLTESVEETLAAAINAALDAVQGVDHE